MKPASLTAMLQVSMQRRVESAGWASGATREASSARYPWSRVHRISGVFPRLDRDNVTAPARIHSFTPFLPLHQAGAIAQGPHDALVAHHLACVALQPGAILATSPDGALEDHQPACYCIHYHTAPNTLLLLVPLPPRTCQRDSTQHATVNGWSRRALNLTPPPAPRRRLAMGQKPPLLVQSAIA